MYARHPRDAVWGGPQSPGAPPRPAGAVSPSAPILDPTHSAVAAQSPQRTQPPTPSGGLQSRTPTAASRRPPALEVPDQTGLQSATSMQSQPMSPGISAQLRPTPRPVASLPLKQPALPQPQPQLPQADPVVVAQVAPVVRPQTTRDAAGTRAMLSVVGFCCTLGLVGVTLLIVHQTRGKYDSGHCAICKPESRTESWVCVSGSGCCYDQLHEGKNFVGTCTERSNSLLVAGLALLLAPIAATLLMWLAQWYRQSRADAEETVLQEAELNGSLATETSDPIPPAAAGTKNIGVIWQGRGVLCSVSRGVRESDAVAAVQKLIGLQPTSRVVMVSPRGEPVALEYDSVVQGGQYYCHADGGPALAVSSPVLPEEACGLYEAALEPGPGNTPMWTRGMYSLSSTHGGSWVVAPLGGAPLIESAPHKGRMPQDLDLPGLWQARTALDDWVECGFSCRSAYCLWEQLEVDLGQGRWVPCWATGYAGCNETQIQYLLRIAPTERHDAADGLAGTALTQPISDPGPDGVAVLRIKHESPPLPRVGAGITSPRKPPEPSFVVKTVSLVPAGRPSSGEPTLVTVARDVSVDRLKSGLCTRFGLRGSIRLRTVAGERASLHYDDLVDGETYVYDSDPADGVPSQPPLTVGSDVDVLNVEGTGYSRGVLRALLSGGLAMVRLVGGGERTAPLEHCRLVLDTASPRRAVSTPERPDRPPSEAVPDTPVRATASVYARSPAVASAMELRNSLSATPQPTASAQQPTRAAPNEAAMALIRKLPVLAANARGETSLGPRGDSAAVVDYLHGAMSHSGSTADERLVDSSAVSIGSSSGAGTPHRSGARRTTRRTSKSSLLRGGPSDPLSPPQPEVRRTSGSGSRLAAPSPSRLGGEVRDLLAQIAKHTAKHGNPAKEEKEPSVDSP